MSSKTAYITERCFTVSHYLSSSIRSMVFINLCFLTTQTLTLDKNMGRKKDIKILNLDSEILKTFMSFRKIIINVSR